MISNISDPQSKTAAQPILSAKEPCNKHSAFGPDKSFTCTKQLNQLPEPPTSTKTCGLSLLDTILNACIRAAPKPRTLSATFNDSGLPTIKTEDGYEISFSGKQEEWTITDQGGNSTRIWGDPHVEESDGDKWDFKENAIFAFGNNKVSVETTPYSKNPSETLTKSITVYNGRERFSITGIDQNNLEFVDWDFDGAKHKQAQTKGTVYHLESTSSKKVNWIKQD